MNPARTPACSLLLLPLLLPFQEVEKKLLTLEQTAGRGESVDFSGELARWSWASDGVHIERARDRERRWLDPATLEESEPTDAAAEEPAPAGRRRPGFGRGASSKAQTALAELDPELAEKAELPGLSPDESRLAYVLDGNLWTAEIATGEKRQLTTDGGGDVLNGKLDWVYQEEVYGRGRYQAHWWSPDSTRIAFLHLDESAVYDFVVVDNIEEGNFRVKAEVTKYPQPGDPNPTVALGVADVSTGAITWVDVSRYAEDEPLIVRVDWTPAGDLLFMVQDRIQTWLDLNVMSSATGKVATLIHESSGAWTERAEPPHWLADGSFLWLSDRTGYRHVYRHAADGRLLAQVTSGEWSVRDLMHVDEEAGRIWFSSTRDGAIDDNVYRVALDGTGLVRLTSGSGTHDVSFNEDRTLFIDRVSSLDTPPRVLLCDAEGEVRAELDRADVSARDEYLVSEWQLSRIPARDGFMLDVAVLPPVPFDHTASYPVWLSTYSGPNAPSVRNRWDSSAWNQFLAENGVIVLQVNVRSASGRGHFDTARAYGRLGVMELRDLEDTVAWLTSHPWADAERVGITGHSYGGFMTAFALTHSDVFALGIAGSGVYDWRLYDTIYTERYMMTPELNPDGYEATSVIAAAKNLHGHLLLTHGVMDDNVHLQNAIRLAYALQKADRSFEMMLYPQSRHGIRDRDLAWHDRELTWKTIREHLLEPGAEPRALEAAARSGSAGGR